jgi:hypothetical protein
VKFTSLDQMGNITEGTNFLLAKSQLEEWHHGLMQISLVWYCYDSVTFFAIFRIGEIFDLWKRRGSE